MSLSHCASPAKLLMSKTDTSHLVIDGIVSDDWDGALQQDKETPFQWGVRNDKTAFYFAFSTEDPALISQTIYRGAEFEIGASADVKSKGEMLNFRYPLGIQDVPKLPNGEKVNVFTHLNQQKNILLKLPNAKEYQRIALDESADIQARSSFDGRKLNFEIKIPITSAHTYLLSPDMPIVSLQMFTPIGQIQSSQVIVVRETVGEPRIVSAGGQPRGGAVMSSGGTNPPIGMSIPIEQIKELQLGLKTKIQLVF
jgi:hypothetical protein